MVDFHAIIQVKVKPPNIFYTLKRCNTTCNSLLLFIKYTKEHRQRCDIYSIRVLIHSKMKGLESEICHFAAISYEMWSTFIISCRQTIRRTNISWLLCAVEFNDKRTLMEIPFMIWWPRWPNTWVHSYSLKPMLQFMSLAPERFKWNFR